MNKSILIIWDKSHNQLDKFEAIPYFRKKLSFTNLGFFNIDESQIDVIDSDIDFLNKDEIKNTIPFERYKAILILDTLNWDNYKGEFNGLKLAQLIRKKKVKIPVFICSGLRKEEIYGIKNQSVEILKTPSHYFIKLPGYSADLKDDNIPKDLSELLLDDILYYTMNKVGKIEEVLHNVKNTLPFEKTWDRLNIKKYENLIKNAQNRIEEILNKEDKEDLNKIFNRIYTELRESKLSPAGVLYSKKDEILLLTENEKLLEIKIKTEWNILFIDDEKNIRELVKSSFEKKGITCYTAKSADEAYDILQKDLQGELKDSDSKILPSNSITIVISDWRFLNELQEWDSLQGYDIIENIHNKMHNVVSFFILTSKKGVIVNQAKKNNNIRISWHSKEDVLDSESSFNLFFNQVFEEGEKTYDTLCGKPKTSSWNKATKNLTVPLKEYYRFYRNLGNYHELEYEINNDVLNYLEEVEYVLEKENKKYDTELPDIEIDLNEIHFNTEFKAKIDAAPSYDDEINMNKFITKLKGRRIALALASEKFGFNADQIINLLKFGKTDPDDEDYLKIMNEKKRQEIEDEGLAIPTEEKQLLPTHLNLSKKIEKDIPHFILPEEINFIEKDLGVPILNRSDRQKYYKINQEIEEVCHKIWRSDPNKYKGDNFLVNPPKVFSERELKKIKEKIEKEYILKFKININQKL